MKNYLMMVVLIFITESAWAKISFEPYYSVTSTKSIRTNRSKDSEKESRKQREEKGIRAGVSFWKLFKLNLSVGQNYLEKTITETTIKDEYDEIDFSSELDSSATSDGTTTVTKETQNKAKATLLFDPGFWIFIARMKAGITAKQRLLSVLIDGVEIKKVNPSITYKPHVGGG